MAQFVIYGHAATLRPRIRPLSDAIHEAAVTALQLPAAKRFHRLVPLDPDCFVAPPDRTTSAIGLGLHDVEIAITETPRANWGIRGVPGDELPLTYQVEV